MRRTQTFWMLISLLLPISAVLAQGVPFDLNSRPKAAPAYFRILLGEYAANDIVISVFEDRGSLALSAKGRPPVRLLQAGFRSFLTEHDEPNARNEITFDGKPGVRPTTMVWKKVVYTREPFDGEDGRTFTITPLYPIEELRRRARNASPPVEERTFRRTNLVEVHRLDSTIRYDIRYATTNNFMKQKFYTRARAFLQRPAAEAFVRAHAWLQQHGYGLLVHDAYRPWKVTKMFWDATPKELKDFVANPATGSRHNRGCAVDVTLFDRKTGEPIEMVSGYDEFSGRSYPDYVGGTSLQRWHRALLRRALEQEGFSVYFAEWWHFDHKGWKEYRIEDRTFEELERK